jgi:nucleoid-associated protein YgaU
VPAALKQALVEVQDAVREVVPAVRHEKRTTPVAPEDAPAPARRRRWGVLVFATLTVLAFAGGMLATVLYDRMVTTPKAPPRPLEDLDAPEPVAEPAAPAGPELTPAQHRALDVQQALADLRATLPLAAVIDVDVRVDGPAVMLTGRVDTRETVDLVAKAAGAVPGVTAVDTRALRIESRLHTLKQGELLSDIAKKYYGRGSAWTRIVKANPGIDPNAVRPGTQLRIPSVVEDE